MNLAENSSLGRKVLIATIRREIANVNVLFASSEVAPFAKTGGLADVCGSLPKEIAKLGHKVVVILPAYRCVWESGQTIEPLNVEVTVPIGGKQVTGQLYESRLPGSEVPVYLVRQDDYYDRDGLYQDGDEDHLDNCERFVFFCRAVLEAIRVLNLNVDFNHTHDWPTALLTAYLNTEFRGFTP